jgi:catechol 2,3-dioxygenase-like lactoylglutathione lyase family enzyme
MTGLTHVALAVSDPDRALHFYRDVVCVSGSIRAEDYGFVIDTNNGVAFTLFRGRRPSGVGEFHIGMSLPHRQAVRDARARLRSLGISDRDWFDEPGYTSFKVVDPDGYLVELFFEE